MNAHAIVKITAIESNFSKPLELAIIEFVNFLFVSVQYVQNPPGYFVEKLHATHYGGLDDDKTLARIIISRQDVSFLSF